VALCGSDVPDGGRQFVSACEDCACATVGAARAAHPDHKPPAGAQDERAWVVGANVLRIPVDRDHTALFNPSENGGVVVVNRAAGRLLDVFSRPTTLHDAAGTDAAARPTFERLIEAQVIRPVGLEPRPIFVASEQLTAWIHLTNSCNLRCSYCYVALSNDTMTEETGRAAMKALFATALANGFHAVRLKYAGGEASIAWRLVQVLHRHAQDLARRHGIRLSAVLLTNGVHLPPEFVDWLSCEDVDVAVSLDGLGELHDAQRPRADGSPSSGMVRTTVERLRARGLEPHLSITVTDGNAGGLADVVRYALDHDLTFSLNLYRPTAGAPDALRGPDRDLLAGLTQAFEAIEKRMPRWSLLGSILDLGQLLSPREHACGAGHDYVVVDHRGRLSRCHMVMDDAVGDVFSGADLLADIRAAPGEEFNPPVDRKTGCSTCTWRYWCSGGCSVATRDTNGTARTRSPYCDVYQTLYPQALRLEGLRLLRYAITPA
jgi:uncharacterized protein